MCRTHKTLTTNVQLSTFTTCCTKINENPLQQKATTKFTNRFCILYLNLHTNTKYNRRQNTNCWLLIVDTWQRQNPISLQFVQSATGKEGCTSKIFVITFGWEGKTTDSLRSAKNIRKFRWENRMNECWTCVSKLLHIFLYIERRVIRCW